MLYPEKYRCELHPEADLYCREGGRWRRTEDQKVVHKVAYYCWTCHKRTHCELRTHDDDPLAKYECNKHPMTPEDWAIILCAVTLSLTVFACEYHAEIERWIARLW